MIELAIVSAAPDDEALETRITFDLRVRVQPPTEVFAAFLRTQIRLRRPVGANDPGIVELFGHDRRATCRKWTSVDTMVPSFRDERVVSFAVACSFDASDAAARWFDTVGAVAPLRFLFSGTVFYGHAGAVQIAMVPHDREAELAMPIEVWHALRRRHVGNGGSVGLGADTLAALRMYRDEHGLPTWDAAVDRLLGGAQR
jgi:hypothetical protein